MMQAAILCITVTGVLLQLFSLFLVPPQDASVFMVVMKMAEIIFIGLLLLRLFRPK